MRKGGCRLTESALVALAYRPTGQFHRLGHVALEIQPERAPLAQLIELAPQIGCELAILALDLAKKIAQLRHPHLPAAWPKPAFSPFGINPVPRNLHTANVLKLF